MGLVRMVARRHVKLEKYDYEELVQIGTIGLIRGIDRIDLKSNFALSTFLVPYINYSILDYYKANELIKINHSVIVKMRKAIKIRKKLEKEDVNITREKIAESMGIKKEDVILIDDIKIEPITTTSCNEVIYKTDYNNIFDTINEEHIELKFALEKLTSEEKRIIKLIFGYEKTHIETAKILGTNPTTIFRKRKKILKKLRESLQD